MKQFEAPEFLYMTSKAKAQQWLINSQEALNKTPNSNAEKQELLRLELLKRQALIDELRIDEIPVNPNADSLQGVYNIIGFNQNELQNSYTGFLTLQKTGEHRVYAEWIIGGEQIQAGIGFFHNDTLVINFAYEGEDQEIFKGVVVYTIIGNDILTGFWSEKHGDDDYIGKEEGRKMDNAELLSSSIHLN